MGLPSLGESLTHPFALSKVTCERASSSFRVALEAREAKLEPLSSVALGLEEICGWRGYASWRRWTKRQIKPQGLR